MDYPLSRRTYLIGSTVAMSTFAGCIEGDGDDSTTEGNEDTDELQETASLDFFNATDIDLGDVDQRIRIGVTDVEPGEEADIYVKASSLRDADIDVTELGVIADLGISSVGWEVVEADLDMDEDIIIRVRVTVTEQDSIDEICIIEMDLTGLQTSNASHTQDLQHVGTTAPTDADPDFAGATKATYDVIDTDELENVLEIGPGNIRAGDTEQEINGRIMHATSELELSIDITPLQEAGIQISNAGVVVDAIENDDEVTVTHSELDAGVIRLGFETGADHVGISCRVTDLDTADAEQQSRITYPIYIGERPSDPQESSPFQISGVTA